MRAWRGLARRTPDSRYLSTYLLACRLGHRATRSWSHIHRRRALLILTVVSAAASLTSVGSVVLARSRLRAASVGLRRVTECEVALLIGAWLGLVGWLLSRGVLLRYFFWVTPETPPTLSGGPGVNALLRRGHTCAVRSHAARWRPVRSLWRGVAGPRRAFYTWLRRWGIVVVICRVAH